jgi:hypothetical protein
LARYGRRFLPMLLQLPLSVAALLVEGLWTE